MNPRIQKLWDEAAESTHDDSWQSQTLFMERFAELIVAECCQQINSQCFPSNSREWCEKGAWNGYLVAQIREHFGVSE